MRSNSCRYWATLIYMLSVTDFNPKGTISEFGAHAGTKFEHAERWSIAKCRFSTKGSFDHHGKAEKENVKKEFREIKKPEHPRRSVRKLMNTLLTTHARMAVWKLQTWSRQRLDDLMFTSGTLPSWCPQEHTACIDFLCRQVRGRLVIVCGTPGPMAWLGNISASAHSTLTNWALLKSGEF